GSGNGPAFKAGEDGIAGLRTANARVHARLAEAQRVAIVGAGAVGTELAGELAYHMPGKHITLVSADATLFPTWPTRLGTSLLAQLRSAGVDVVRGAKVENLQSVTEPYAGTLRLSTGQTIGADLIIPAVGSRANSELLAGLPGAVKSTGNRVIADGWMRPSTLANVFAAGDVADLGDPMTIASQMRQLPWLRDTLLALLQGEPLENRPRYQPADASKGHILIPLGPYQGASYLGRFTVGPFLTRLIKGKDLFITRYRKQWQTSS
ncbi:MAG TPA: FAD-dependent oxidoreductase, partial [Azonexus sp.]|nr:FAD-dependent oxidoreductase [Azonexus sp.]